jgi:hypothetical protein
LFAGTNEVLVEGDYGTPTKEYYMVQNGYNQTFVNTVRSTGGCNHYRHLIVQGFNTNINHTVNYFKAPEDVMRDRLMVEVHYYDPYNFTINGNSNVTQWGKNATDPLKTETWANESYADSQFNKMKTHFVNQGYGVILGEYGAIARTNLGSDELNAGHAEYRRYYLQYITGSICKHGLAPFYWDSGFTGNNASGLFNRNTGEQAYPEIIRSIVDAAGQNTAIEPPHQDVLPVRPFLMRNVPNPFNPATRITFDLPEKAHVSLKILDILGREIVTLAEEEFPAGRHILTWDASGVCSGEYICRLQTESMVETQKLIVLK